MERNLIKLQGITIASTNIESMVGFYENVFGVIFTEQDMFGAKLYSGNWLGISLLLCPAEIAQNTATQNRHQLDILIPDFDEVISKVLKFGGSLMNDISEENGIRKAGVYDPDNNSMVLIEHK